MLTRPNRPLFALLCAAGVMVAAPHAGAWQDPAAPPDASSPPAAAEGAVDEPAVPADQEAAAPVANPAPSPAAELPPEAAKAIGQAPPPLPEFHLPKLDTVPAPQNPPEFQRRTVPGPSWVPVDAPSPHLDPQGIWVLDFAFKPVRMIEVEVPGKGRRNIYYLYYRVLNRTGQPRPFVPQFTLVTEDGKRHEDVVLPLAVRKIQAKEDPTTKLLGAVEIVGELPPSRKEIDDAVYGVAIWDNVDFRADRFAIYVRGLSDAYQVVPDGGPDGQPLTRYKAVRIDLIRYGDELDPKGREIRLNEPPAAWIYYPETDRPE